MKSLQYASLLLLLGSSLGLAERMEPEEQPDEVGLVSIGSAYFPNPHDLEVFRLPGGGFEEERGEEWSLSGFQVAASKEAPEGMNYLTSRGDSGVRLVLPGFPVHGQWALLLSMWLKTDADGLRAVFSTPTEATRFGTSTNLQIPNTEGEWKRVGFYLRPPAGAEAGEFKLQMKDAPVIGLDDIRLRKVTEPEYAVAWQGWRDQYPERDLSPRPNDGKHLALFMEKVRDVQAVEPLRVMGIGSSYTNMLGNGERLTQHLRSLGVQRPILYRKHVGSSVNFDFTKGWMQQLVVGEQPDLVILYSGGEAEDLDELLTEFRSRSTADVIVASLHLRERAEVISPETIDNEQWDGIRAVCEKHGVEFVESRREWAAYLLEHDQPIEWLLKDAVHQNDHGALVINENIIRHLHRHPEPACDPQERERTLTFRNPRTAREGETIAELEDGWEIRFFGNRLDLSGGKNPDGGILDVWIDGQPAAEFPAFHRTLIVPGSANHRPERGMTADRAPHMVTLGDGIVPQDWTIRMTSDVGDYELIGSITSVDGNGNNQTDFLSESGQIGIPTALWRRKQERDGSFSNRTGDVFTFSVRRATTASIDFSGVDGRYFRVSLVDNASNDWHTVRLVKRQEGNYDVGALHIFEPPLKR